MMRDSPVVSNVRERSRTVASTNLDWNVALAGACLVSRPFAMHDDNAFMAVVDLLRSAHMTYGHLELKLRRL